MKTLFSTNGVHAVVDGQFGSTGKGVLAAWLAHRADLAAMRFGGTISNAGPNSGHTFYHDGAKHVLKQLPTFAVATYLLSPKAKHPVYLSAGAIIDPEILAVEARKYPGIDIFVHPMAAIIRPEDKEAEHSGSIAAVAGTRSGTGAALARKVLREPDAIFTDFYSRNYGYFPSNVVLDSGMWWSDAPWLDRPYFMEVSQGFSLGLNSRFYPKVTSRECTVMQGLADARIPATSLNRTYLSMRTYPIRVGNVDGYSSGDFYPDQREVSWEEIGQKPELTTVTQRVRRVFTFSEMQAVESIIANAPDFVFLNFLNYLTERGQADILERLYDIRDDLPEFDLIGGYGPTSDDVRLL